MEQTRGVAPDRWARTDRVATVVLVIVLTFACATSALATEFGQVGASRGTAPSSPPTPSIPPPLPAPQYAVIFVPIGLPLATPWSVTVAGETNSSSTGSVGFQEQNGTFGFNLTPIDGYGTNQSSGSFAVNGSNMTISIDYWAADPPPPPGPLPSGPAANANLTLPTASPVQLNDGRLGVDVRADVPFTSLDSNALNSTGADLLRWPGGALADRYNPLANSFAGAVYTVKGTWGAPATSFGEFAAWCKVLQCQSIVTLPAEIDNASLAAAIVNYSVQSLDFQPTYWEIGNEPQLWSHFDIPWVSWNASQNVSTTPMGFALLVQAYVSAIHAVDPAAAILGMGGVGSGNISQSTWIENDIAVNGPNLTGVAVHLYPAGVISQPEPPAYWFASLQGRSALGFRLNTTLRNIANACATCNLTLFVDELGTGMLVPPSDEIEGGYLASFVSAEILESLQVNAGSFDYFNLQSNTPGSWFNQSGTPSGTYFAFENWHQRVGPYAAPLGVNSSSSGLLAAVGGSVPGNWSNLILVNINATQSFTLNLSQNFPGVPNASILEWNGSSASPVNLTYGAYGVSNFTIPPTSLAIFTFIGPPSFGMGSLLAMHASGENLRSSSPAPRGVSHRPGPGPGEMVLASRPPSN